MPRASFISFFLFATAMSTKAARLLFVGEVNPPTGGRADAIGLSEYIPSGVKPFNGVRQAGIGL
jgi:hypothetical protein